MSRLIRIALAFVSFAFAFGASAQVVGDSKDDAKKSHFGVTVSFGLPSEAKDSFRTLFDAKRIDLKSRDFEIGFVRGRDLGGEWGVSFIQKTLQKDSVVDLTQQSCGFFNNPDFCPTLGTKYVLRDVTLRGVSLHKYFPFVTIKRRAQVGLTFAGGAAQVRGTAESHYFYLGGMNQPGTLPSVVERVTVVPGREIFLGKVKTVPLWRAEVTGAVIAAPGLKVKFGTGINFTNYPAMSLGISYLIGAR